MNEFQKQLLSELRELNKTLKVIASNQERGKIVSKDGLTKAMNKANDAIITDLLNQDDPKLL